MYGGETSLCTSPTGHRVSAVAAAESLCSEGPSFMGAPSWGPGRTRLTEQPLVPVASHQEALSWVALSCPPQRRLAGGGNTKISLYSVISSPNPQRPGSQDTPSPATQRLRAGGVAVAALGSCSIQPASPSDRPPPDPLPKVLGGQLVTYR